eukprot:5077187-Prymnesium_polylepis.1
MATFAQHECGQALMHQQGPVQIVFRRISIKALDGCDLSMLSFPGVEPKRCGSEYTQIDKQTWGVCTTASVCEELAMPGVPL